MQYLTSAVAWLSEQIRPYSFQVATAIVATLLFIYGASINRHIREKLRGKPFVLRVSIFIAVCAFGYGALTVAAAALIAKILYGLNAIVLAPAVVLSFVVIGMLAERGRHI